jgi:hypothetical protein
MKVEVLLADKGTLNQPQGTLNLLNVGWKQTVLQPSPLGPGMFMTAPHAVAVFFEVEPRHCNHPIELVLSLLTEDGNPVQLPGPAGPQELRISQRPTIPSPGGMPTGSPGSGNALVEIFPGLPLAPGGYRWQVMLDGEHDENWFASFRVNPPPLPPTVVFGTPPPSSAPPEDPT